LLLQNVGKDSKIYRLVILCVLLLNIGSAYAANTTEAKILSPLNGAMVSIKTDVIIDSKNIPAGQSLWKGMYILDVDRFYIFSMNDSMLIGMPYDDCGLEFTLLSILADKKADAFLRDFLDKCDAENSNPGLEKIPDGAKICDRKKVTRI
jgi:hypothetical protein